jgi:DNA-binding response OmpR family regulator
VTREELAHAVAGRGAESVWARDPNQQPENVREYDPSVDRSLDVHISHLRQKIGDDAREPKRIRTVRGVGYVLVKPT